MKKLLTGMFEYRIFKRNETKRNETKRNETKRNEHTYAKKLEGGAAI